MWRTTAMGFMAVALAGALVACGDDETSTTTTTTTTAATTGTGGMSASSSTSSSGGATASSTASSSSAGGSGGEGTGGSGTGGSQAAAFCADFESTCGYGQTGRFADSGACTTYFDAASTACQGCMNQHMGLAETMSANTHCPHACGEGPCSGACGTSGCQ